MKSAVDKPHALLAFPGFLGLVALWRKPLPPTKPGFFAVTRLCCPCFRDFSPTADFSGGVLALVTSGWFFTGGFHMHIHAAQPLFAWGCLDDSPTLVTLRAFLDTIPDQ